LSTKKQTPSLYQGKTLTAIVLTLAWPTIVEQIFQTVVQYVDSAMVGRIGAHASAAVGVTSTAMWLMNSFSFAVGVGFLACVSRATGAGEVEKARTISAQAVFVSLAVGAITGGSGILISGGLPHWMGASPEICPEASAYFAILCGSLVFRCPIIVFGSVLRAAGDMRTPMYVNAVTNIVNVVFNFLLIYPSRSITLFGKSYFVPGAGMGVVGAAWGTAIAFVVGILFMAVAVYRNPLVSPAGYPLKPNFEILSRVGRICFPNVMQRTVVCLGQVAFTALITSLGTIPLAAHSIAITAEQAFYMPGSGFQAAATTLSGQALGAGDKDKIKKIIGVSGRISVIVLACTGFLLFLFPNYIMSIFTPDQEVIQRGAEVLRLVSISEPFFGLTMVLEGAFNGVGDTKSSFYIALVSMWLLRILPTWICVHFLHLGLIAVWCCMVLDVISRALLLLIRYLKGNWLKNLV
jgi:putative MATE family efflux protein